MPGQDRQIVWPVAREGELAFLTGGVASGGVGEAEPLTDALRRALVGCDASVARDLRFLERWERDPEQDLAATLRAGQIRRANPALAAAIRAELAGRDRDEAGRRAGNGRAA